MHSSRQNTGDPTDCPIMLFSGIGPEPRGLWSVLVVIVLCSPWASASLALANTTSQQQEIFPAPSTWLPAGLPSGDFSSVSPMQNNVEQSQETWELDVAVVPLHPEVPTGPVGRESVPGTSSVSHVVPEGSDDKRASRRAGDWKSQSLFLSFSSRHHSPGSQEQTISMTNIPAASFQPIRSGPLLRGPKKIASSTDSFLISPLAHIWISASPPPTRPLKHSPSTAGTHQEFLSTIKEYKGLALRGFTGSPSNPKHFTGRSRQPATSPGGTMLATTSGMDVSSDSKFFLSLLPRTLRGLSRKQSPSTVPAPRSPSLSMLQHEEADPTAFLPKAIKSTLELTQPVPALAGEIPGTMRAQETSTVLFPTKMSLYGRMRSTILPDVQTPLPGPGFDPQVESASSQSLLHAFTEVSFSSGIPPDSDWTAEPKTSVFNPSLTPFMEISLDAIPVGSARPQNNQVSHAAVEVASSSLNQITRQAGAAVPTIQHQGSPELSHHSENLTLATSGNLSSPEPEAAGKGAELQATQLFPAHATSPGSQDGGGRTKLVALDSSFHTPIQLRTRAIKASDTPKPLDPSLPVFPESSEIPEEQLNNVLEVKAGPARLDQEASTDFTPFLHEPKAEDSTPAPWTTWANTFASKQESSHISFTKRQEKLPWTPTLVSHSPLEILTHSIRRQGSSSPSPSNLITSVMAESPHPGPARRDWPWPVYDNESSDRVHQKALTTARGAKYRRETVGPSLLTDKGSIFPIWDPDKKVLVATPTEIDIPSSGSTSRQANTAFSPDKATLFTFSSNTNSSISSLPNAPEPAYTMPVVTWAASDLTASPDTPITGWPRTRPSLAQLHTEETPPEQTFTTLTKSTRTGWVLPTNSWSTSRRANLSHFPTSGAGHTRMTLPKFTFQKVPTWKRGHASLGSEIPIYIIPLHFNLSQISYIPFLKDRNSTYFRRLKWEVIFTFRRILSYMNGFMDIYLHQFSNESVFVHSLVEIEREAAPTSSDLIRSVVTMLRRKMDTYFSWKVDLASLYSSGYRLENLEPEKLSISFMIPRLDSLADGETLQHLLDNLREQVIQDLGRLYPVKKYEFLSVRVFQKKLFIRSEAYVHSQAWANISQVLQALTGLAKQSVDLTSLIVEGSRLDLQLLPISFLVTDEKFVKFWLEHSSLEHQSLFRELSSMVKHALNTYRSLLQVMIHDCLNDTFICVGELLFQPPGPEPHRILQTLVETVDSGGHFAGSEFQVDPSSFCIAEERLAFPPGSKKKSGTSVAVILLPIVGVFIGFILAVKYLRNRQFRCWHQGTFSLFQAYQMHRDTLELRIHEESGQQEESPVMEMVNIGFQEEASED